MTGILVFFHCPSNTGYAIGRHEVTFASMAEQLVGSFANVHYGYPRFVNGPSRDLPKDIENFVRFDAASRDASELTKVRDYVQANNIRLAFGFDQPASRPSYRFLREGGVERIVSYWGAPMSSICPSVLLPLRKLQYRLRRNGPDHYVFQSEDMRKTATHGVGIPYGRTSVVRSGVDTDRFRPDAAPAGYVHEALGIPKDRKVVYYSGHMEERKGVHIIVQAAAHLVNLQGRRDLHFLFLGNQQGEESRFDSFYKGTAAEDFVTFGGYRDDVAELQASSYMAVIATTGWDSHTMTAVEVASSGLPLIVSDLPGIQEAISPETGLWFKAGDPVALSDGLIRLADDQDLRDRLGAGGRARVLAGYTRRHQIQGLVDVVRSVWTHGGLRG